jgi:hypothetical protein
MDRTLIYCYNAGKLKDGNYLGVAKTISLDGEITTIHSVQCTHPKYVEHDLGCKLKFNMYALMKSYISSLEIYRQLFGKNKFQLIYVGGNEEFNQIVQVKLNPFQINYGSTTIIGSV